MHIPSVLFRELKLKIILLTRATLKLSNTVI